ncbi:DUF6894 family protein [Sphingoaurantiacus capsulatus]|uniref:DUF6894 family protein n=1 Tax=Sphingoaurantiacus capsulatus TaxID=1771310 RepID=A0ABV7XDJ6_9SPHN
MPTYYFHLRFGPRVQLDSEGADFADLAAAKREAITSAAARISAQQHPGDDPTDWRIEIADAGGQHVATVDPSGVVAD